MQIVRLCFEYGDVHKIDTLGIKVTLNTKSDTFIVNITKMKSSVKKTIMINAIIIAERQ